MKTEVVIVGAGAAGLSCARALEIGGCPYVVLEGRDRPWGRVLSVESPWAVELGAEFLHAPTSELIAEIARHGLSFYDGSDTHWVRRGKLKLVENYYHRFEKLSRALRPERKVDRSVAEFLAEQPKSAERELFRSFAEGFYSADLQRMGEKGLAQAELGDSTELSGVDQFRPIPNYTAFLDQLLDPSTLNLRFNSRVVKIRYGRNLVATELDDGSVIESSRVVVTIPLGVLKAGALVFAPEVAGLARILSRVHMGHVQKVVFEFDRRFWEELTPQPAGFFHASSSKFLFPTWWTQVPMRTPILSGWQGGPRAEAMGAWSEEMVVQRALRSLGQLMGRSPKFLTRHLLRSHRHNWTADPFSRGAYSYPGLDCERSLRLWRKPMGGGLIYFAGEATVSGAMQGTVIGAILSGRRAARQVLSVRGRR